MKTFTLLFVSAAICVGLNAQTTHRYTNTFDSNSDLAGWSFTSSETEATIQNGKLVVTSTNDDFFYILTPLGSNKYDFSVRIVAAMDSDFQAGFIGRSAFKSIIGLLTYENNFELIYANDLQSFENPVWETLFSGEFPPYDLTSLEISVQHSGQDLDVNFFINDELFSSGTVNNVHPDLLYGQIILGYAGTENNLTLIIDEVDIRYNPMIDETAVYIDHFDNTNSPWFRTGDFEFTYDAIKIVNGNLHFNYVGANTPNLFAICPVGGVGDFTAEFYYEGLEMNGIASFSRFSDYRHNITLFYSGDEAYFSYANGTLIPVIISSATVNPPSSYVGKFSVNQIGNDLFMQLWHDNELVLTATLQNAPEKLLYGHLALAFHACSQLDVKFNQVNINFSPVFVGLKPEFTQITRPVIQIKPNPIRKNAEINFALEESSTVKLIVYDLLGNLVKTVFEGYLLTGDHTILFEAEGFTGGIYFCRMKTGSVSTVRKMVISK